MFILAWNSRCILFSYVSIFQKISFSTYTHCFAVWTIGAAHSALLQGKCLSRALCQNLSVINPRLPIPKCQWVGFLPCHGFVSSSTISPGPCQLTIFSFPAVAPEKKYTTLLNIGKSFLTWLLPSMYILKNSPIWNVSVWHCWKAFIRIKRFQLDE